MQKGQGTIEYLVIIAIVVVIALVVVGLLLQVMQQGSGIPESTSKTAWKSAEPFAIIDWARSGGSMTLILKNNTSETLDMNTFKLTSSNTNDGSGNSNIAPGSNISITVSGLGSCSSGTKYSYPKDGIVIDYNSANIAHKMQKGVADIVGTCQ